MAQAAQAPAPSFFTDDRGELGPVVQQQSESTEAIALEAPQNGDEGLAPASAPTQWPAVKSLLPQSSWRAAAFTMAAVTTFVAGMLAQFAISGIAEATRKIDAQKRQLDALTVGLKQQEDKLLAKDVEMHAQAEEFKRQVAEAETKLKSEVERRVGAEAEVLKATDEQNRLSAELTAKQQAEEQNHLEARAGLEAGRGEMPQSSVGSSVAGVSAAPAIDPPRPKDVDSPGTPTGELQSADDVPKHKTKARAKRQKPLPQAAEDK